jgi:hypothetical protein
MNAQPLPPWWEDPQADWTTGDPGRLLDLLVSACPDRAVITAIAESVGFNPRDLPGETASARDIWIRLLKETARAGQVPDLMAEALHDPSVAEAYPLIAWLIGETLVAAIERRAHRPGHGMESAEDQPHRAPASAPALSGHPVGGLQAITSTRARLSEFRPDQQAIADLGLRTAAILVRGRPAGTGVLARGEEFILTAAHVIGARNWHLVSPASIVAVFDYESQPGRSPAETGEKVGVTEVVCGSPPTDAEIAADTRNDWEAPRDYLDFALLRLASWPRNRDSARTQRGYYPIDTGIYAFDQPGMLYLMQFPLGGFLCWTQILESPSVNSERSRIRYYCDTLPGSSGGPIVNTRGQLVAIHQYAARTSNQGVPVSAIAQYLRDDPHAHRYESATVNNVTYLAVYSRGAREEVCRKIGARWQKVAKELDAPRYIVSPSEMWEWLRSSRKLGQLRSTLAGLGYLDLVDVLDRDIIDQSHSYELSKLAEMGADSSRLLQSVSRGKMASSLRNLIALTTDARHLAEELEHELDSLPAWQDDLRLRLDWRMAWDGALDRARRALCKLSEMLPQSTSDERRAMNRRSAMVTQADVVQAAIAKLSELAQNWPIAP